MPNAPENKGDSKAPTIKEFTDHRGNTFRPMLLVPDLIELCRKYNVRLQDLTEGNTNLGDLLEATWFAVRKEAISYGIGGPGAFFDRMPMDYMMRLLQVTLNNLVASIPGVGELLPFGMGGITGTAEPKDPKEKSPDGPTV